MDRASDFGLPPFNYLGQTPGNTYFLGFDGKPGAGNPISHTLHFTFLTAVFLTPEEGGFFVFFLPSNYPLSASFFFFFFSSFRCFRFFSVS